MLITDGLPKYEPYTDDKEKCLSEASEEARKVICLKKKYTHKLTLFQLQNSGVRLVALGYGEDLYSGAHYIQDWLQNYDDYLEVSHKMACVSIQTKKTSLTISGFGKSGHVAAAQQSL